MRRSALDHFPQRRDVARANGTVPCHVTQAALLEDTRSPLDVDVVLDAYDEHLGRVLDQVVPDSRQCGRRLNRPKLAERVAEVDVSATASAVANARPEALGRLHEPITQVPAEFEPARAPFLEDRVDAPVGLDSVVGVD